jgi:hypothetical protein
LELRKQKIYKNVYEMACKELLGSDREAQFAHAAVAFETRQKGYRVDVPYFDEIISLELPEFSFKSSKEANVTLVTKIIILHYINIASGASLGADKIPYEDIPGLAGYLPVFERKAAKPLVATFGFDRHAFLEAGLSLGGEREDYGDASFTLHAFPRVPITFILWEGDEEFPPSIKILFDPSIRGYLPLEDISVISKLASTRIVKEARLKYSDD